LPPSSIAAHPRDIWEQKLQTGLILKAHETYSRLVSEYWRLLKAHMSENARDMTG